MLKKLNFGFCAEMSTRQLRLNKKEEIITKLPTLIGKKIQLVLRNQTPIFATLKEAEGSNLVLLNMRLKKFSVQLNDVSEIYYDTTE